MFGRLFGKRNSSWKITEAPRSNFDAAYQMLIARGAALKDEYDRTRADIQTDYEIRSTLKEYGHPEYLREILQAVSALTKDPEHEPSFKLVPVVAKMFMTMASDAFGSHAEISKFAPWANSFSGKRADELIRFAYTATVWEQQ